MKAHHVERPRAGNEDRQSPVGRAVVPIRFPLVRGQEAQHLAVDVFLATRLELAADVVRYGFDVPLQPVHVAEDAMVDALQHIVGRVGLARRHPIGVVYQARPQGADIAHRPLRMKVAYDA